MEIGCVAVYCNWHFEFYILKCKKFLIELLDELENFKPKKFYTSKYHTKLTPLTVLFSLKDAHTNYIDRILCHWEWSNWQKETRTANNYLEKFLASLEALSI